MKLKRHFEAAAFKAWDKKRQADIRPKVAALVSAGLDEAAATKSCLQKYADENGIPAISHVDVLRCGKEWRPSRKVIEQGVSEGWISIANGKITIKTGPDADDMVFIIKAAPGRDGHQYDCVRGK